LKEMKTEEKQYWKEVVKKFKASTDFKRLNKGYQPCDKILRERKAIKKVFRWGQFQ
jgi:hypothetical protein